MLKEAFINEENNHRLQGLLPMWLLLQNLAHTPPSSKTLWVCVFCGKNGHVQETCYQYKDFQLQARQKVLNQQSQSNSHSNSSNCRPNCYNTSANLPANTSSTYEQAGNIQDSGNIEEIASNASITSPDLPLPEFTQQLLVCKYRGIFAHDSTQSLVC
jgi:hypothetical protein